MNNPASYPCLDAFDIDDNGIVEMADQNYLFDALYGGGPPPPAPGFSTCGFDPTVETMDVVTCQELRLNACPCNPCP